MSDEILKRFQKELNSGAISMALLALLHHQQAPMYGYEIAKNLESKSKTAMPNHQSAIYPVLRSLEKQGLLASELTLSDAGPPRKYYRLTPAGKKLFPQLKAAWLNTQTFVNSLLEASHESPSSSTRRALSEGTRTAAQEEVRGLRRRDS